MKSGILGLLALAFLAAAAQAAPPILTGPRGAAGNPPANIRSTTHGVRFNADQMLNLGPGEEVELNLPSGRRHPYVFELRQAHGDGIYSWIGKHKERGNHSRAIVTTGPGGSFAVFETPDGEYRLVPGENGNDVLIDMTAEAPFIPAINLGDDGLIPPVSKNQRQATFAPETMVRIPGVNSLAVPKATPVPQYVVDLMIVYTTGLAQNLGANLMTRLYFLVTRANTAYADSEVAITLRLVRAVQANYTDAPGDQAALFAISPNRPEFDASAFHGIEAARASAGADLVAFLRNGLSFGGSGLAWVGSTSPDPLDMYSLVTGCVLGCESVFIHELGHNMGNKHDRPTTSWQAGGTASPPAGAFSYSFGYAFCKSGTLTCNPTLPNGSPPACGPSNNSANQPECSTTDNSNFGDIMAYFQGTAQTIYKFSNPGVSCATANGDLVPRPCGVSEVAGDSANTALSMNNNRAVLSALRSAVTGTNAPGSLQFTATAVAAAESAGTMTFNVSRLGGSSGAVGVTYATTSGTAVAGVDYVATSGNLSWGDGDTANKPISVTLIANGANAVSPRFTVGLSSPTGPAGVSLGFPTVATGIIYEAWPPGGIFPAGYLTPDGSTAAWTLASDQVFEGPASLRSGSVTGNGDFATFFNSDISYTATFTGGLVGCAYRVSSYPFWGTFDFLIDGTVVLRADGESGWQYFTTPVSAGLRTLRWRFRNALPFACAVANPPPPGGGSCADRAWIDAISLPPSVPVMLGVKSRKTHAAGGTFDITLDATQPIGSAVTVEERAIGSGHKVVFQFGTAITSTGTVSCVDAASNPVGSVSSAIVGNTVEVTLTGVPENKRVTVSLGNVNALGIAASASLGFLTGDVNGSRSVTSSDILAAKGRSGLTFGTTNWPYDVNLTGTLDSSDVTAVKANAGLSIP